MSTIERCTCTPYYQDAGGGYTEYVPEWEPFCSEHGEIDHILAYGQYTDRRGRKWKNITHLNVESWAAEPYGRPDILPAQMRLMIERDQHRGECRGLDSCTSHPVPHVLAGRAFWGLFYVYEGGPMGIRSTLAEAMDAARALAVNP